MTISYDENHLSDSNAESLNWNIQDQLKGLSLDEIRKVQPKLPYAICMLNTSGSLNIGVTIRSAVMFGCSKVFIVGRRRFDSRSLVGSNNYIDIKRIDAIDSNGNYDIDKIWSTLHYGGYCPVGIETKGIEIQHFKELYTSMRSPCFIFGEEQKGIPDELYSSCHYAFKIPTLGVMRSLNVSVAASITMYEAMKVLSK